MNPMRRRALDQQQAALEHRRREDEAPRLHDAVEHLQSLRFRFEDVRAEGRTLALTYTKPIVVASAPACFEIRCMEARCNGRHDLSAPVLTALRQAKTAFEGRSECTGTIGDVPCDRTLAYACEATYST